MKSHQHHDIKDITISMPDNKSTPLLVRIPAPLLAKIDQWRRLQDDPPSRPEAVRRLAEAGLDAGKQERN